jgi:hypothetical protein
MLKFSGFADLTSCQCKLNYADVSEGRGTGSENEIPITQCQHHSEQILNASPCKAGGGAQSTC